MKACFVLAVVATLLGAAGCQENWQSLYIRDNKMYSDPPECSVSTEESAAAFLAGIVDVEVSNTYLAHLYVENNLMARADYGLPRAESNGVFVHGAYLYYEADPRCPANYTSVENRFSFFIPPGDAAVLGTILIPGSVGNQIVNTLATCPAAGGYLEVIVTVQLFGVTQAGTNVLTQEFDFPVTFCSGCLIYCPVGVDADPYTEGCQCDCYNEDDVEDMPCLPGQDTLIDCRLAPPCIR
jgi:hypothetical protein